MARTVKGGVSDFSRPALSLVACRGDNTKGNFKGKIPNGSLYFAFYDCYNQRLYMLDLSCRGNESVKFQAKERKAK